MSEISACRGPNDDKCLRLALFCHAFTSVDTPVEEAEEHTIYCDAYNIAQRHHCCNHLFAASAHFSIESGFASLKERHAY